MAHKEFEGATRGDIWETQDRWGINVLEEIIEEYSAKLGGEG